MTGSVPGRYSWRCAPAEPTDWPWARSSSSRACRARGAPLPESARGSRLRGGRQPAGQPAWAAWCGTTQRPGSPGDRHGQPHPRLRAGAGASARLSQARTAGRTCLLFLECDDEVLRRRFTETRRRHPLADLPGVGDALAAERELMAPLKAAADMVIDTTDLSLPDLRRLLAGRFGAEGLGAGDHGHVVRLPPRPAARGRSGLRRALPPQSALCRCAARRRTGHDPGVQEYVRADPAFQPFVSELQAMLLPLLPRYQCEGKSYLTIAFGCTRRQAPLGVPGGADSPLAAGLRLGGDQGAP